MRTSSATSVSKAGSGARSSPRAGNSPSNSPRTPRAAALCFLPPLRGGGAPAPRRAATLVTLRRQGFLFGGWLGETGYSSELFAMAPSRDAAASFTVAPCLTAGPAPAPRAGHAACALPDLRLMAVMGGAVDGGHLDDLHLLDCETLEWKPAVAPGALRPAPRSRHAMEYVPGALFVFGGSNEAQDHDDVWKFSLAEQTWKQVVPSGLGPCARWGLTAVAVKKKIYVFGGQKTKPTHSPEEQAALSRIYVLDTTTMTWETPASTGLPPVPRGGHTCSLFGDRFLVFLGGGDGVVVHNECFCYDTLSDEWLTLQLGPFSVMLPPRWAHAAMPTADGQLIICGGANGPISYGEIVSLAVDLLVAKAFMEKMTSGSVENVGQPLDRVVSLRDSPTTTPHSSTEDSLLLQLPPHQQRPPASGPNGVAAWLRSVGAEELIPLFAAENISMRMVPQLTERHLEELGVSSLSLRLGLLAGIQSLRSAASSTEWQPVVTAVQDLGKHIEALAALREQQK